MNECLSLMTIAHYSHVTIAQELQFVLFMLYQASHMFLEDEAYMLWILITAS